MRWLVPEVVQTSAMDCGPAALAALLQGHGIQASYGRLREACQTGVDGTSIDVLEDVANQLGLEAEQVVIPVDHVRLPEAGALPAIVVVRLPSGVTHFVLAWRSLGPYVQLMDPATGRRWVRWERFLHDLYVHRMPVPAEAWREWAGGEALAPLRRRMRDLGVSSVDRVLAPALADPDWRPLAAVDAATRLVASLVAAGGVRKGDEAARLVERLASRAFDDDGPVPRGSWAVWPAPPDDEGEPQVELTGAVLVRVRGRRPGPPPEGLSTELAAALDEPPSRPGRELWTALREDGLVAIPAIVAATALAAGGVVLEALLLRGALDAGRDLALPGQRLAAVVALVGLALVLLGLEGGIAGAVLRLGRHLETRLRVRFLAKIPRLNDRYFQSRLVSDMAERGHSAWAVRQVPELGRGFLRATLQLGATAVGLALLDPALAPLALLAAVAAIAVPVVAQPVLTERDLRVRNHAGALSRFYLDALLGLVPIRAHGGDRNVRREHESLLVEWVHAGWRLQRAVAAVDGVVALAGAVLGAALVGLHVARAAEPGTVLLFVYWTLAMPALGQQIALAARQYPLQRNLLLRLVEPLGAPEEPWTEAAPPGDGAVAIRFEGVSVVAAGQTILDGVDVDVPPGGHVAVVGASGAGKSSLVGLLLGWHRAAAGRVLVDGEPLDAARLDALRRSTAWVDPAVQLWNRSLVDNLAYGADPSDPLPLAAAMDAARLGDVVQRLPDGLQTALGEGGALVSGGEGQRTRLARAFARQGVRLAILDEPFRGLDHGTRRDLLVRARAWWKDATLLCVTHDVGDTMAFERVVVVDGGRVVEDGDPRELAARPGSRFHALLAADEAARRGLWTGARWRRLRLERGRLEESA